MKKILSITLSLILIVLETFFTNLVQLIKNLIATAE